MAHFALLATPREENRRWVASGEVTPGRITQAELSTKAGFPGMSKGRALVTSSCPLYHLQPVRNGQRFFLKMELMSV